MKNIIESLHKRRQKSFIYVFILLRFMKMWKLKLCHERRAKINEGENVFGYVYVQIFYVKSKEETRVAPKVVMLVNLSFCFRDI